MCTLTGTTAAEWHSIVSINNECVRENMDEKIKTFVNKNIFFILNFMW